MLDLGNTFEEMERGLCFLKSTKRVIHRNANQNHLHFFNSHPHSHLRLLIIQCPNQYFVNGPAECFLTICKLAFETHCVFSRLRSLWDGVGNGQFSWPFPQCSDVKSGAHPQVAETKSTFQMQRVWQSGDVPRGWVWGGTSSSSTPTLI